MKGGITLCIRGIKCEGGYKVCIGPGGAVQNNKEGIKCVRGI